MNSACDWFELLEFVDEFVFVGQGGPPGPAGEAIFIPAVSEEGWISWTNTAGLPNPDPVDIKGPGGDYDDLTDKPSINGVTLSGNKTTAELLISFSAADIGAVSKSGDTMTGPLINDGYSFIAKSFSQEDGIAPSTTSYLPGLFLHDKNGSIIGCFREIFDNSGIQSLQLYSRRRINGNDLTNAVRLNLNSSGDASVSFSHPEAWYKAMGYVAGDTISFPTSGNSFFTRFHGDWRYTNVLFFFIPTSRRCAGLSATLSGTIYIVTNGTRNPVNVADANPVCFCTEGGIAVQLSWTTAPSYGAQFALASIQPYGLTITFS